MRLPLLATIFAAGFSASGAQAVTYTITGLGTLGGYAALPQDLNDKGQVVGYSFLPGNNYSAFLYDGTMHDLGALYGVGGSSAQSINNQGQITGYAPNADNSNSVGFLYSSGVMSPIPTLGGKSDYPWDINDAGSSSAAATRRSALPNNTPSVFRARPRT